MKNTSLSLPKVLLFAGLLAGLLAGAISLSKISNKTDKAPGPIAVQTHDNKCIDNNKQHLKAGDKVQLIKCNGKESQQWTHHADGSLRIQNYCMQIADDSKKPKTIVKLHECNGSTGQIWEVSKSGAITNPSSKLCLEPKDSEKANGSEVWVNKCNGSYIQKWSISAAQSPKTSQSPTPTEQSPKTKTKSESSVKETQEKTDRKTSAPVAQTKKEAAQNSSSPTTQTTNEATHNPSPPVNSPVQPPKTEQPPAPSPAKWSPKVGQTWQYQLMDKIDLSIKAAVYDIDGFDTPASTVSAIHNQGSYAICYISAGSWEEWRSDAGKFPASVKGKNLDGWPGEKWLDTRNIDALAPIMSSRMDMCVSKGFDGIEFDNVDGHIQNSGFSISDAQQLSYNQWLARTARAKGLKVGLKNDLDQVSRLVNHYDFAVNEECFSWSECDELLPFINAGKPVFHVEYDNATSKFCSTTTRLGFSSIKKSLDLNAPLDRC